MDIRKTLFSKMRRPVHISYIQKYILKLTEEQTREILNDYISQGVIIESEYAKDYYVLKKQE